jgi:DNA processing protein
MRSQTLVLASEDYPHLLKNIFDPPKSLNIAGALPDFDLHPPVAVIGSRKPTGHGERMAFEIAGSLGKAGFTVVSGLAYGIDSVAHRACLDNSGVTAAVLGSGLEHIYPAVHKKLAEEIVQRGGAVISEYGPKELPLQHHFPERNRIISGLSLGVVVVEAAVASGTLITARSALEQGREVMAVPGLAGNVNTGGTHRLIREGAALVESAQDVIDILSPRLSKEWNAKFSGQSFGIGDKERRLLDRLNDKPKTVDVLIDESGLLPQDVLSAVTVLECAGLITDKDGRGYVKKEELD